MTGSPLLVYGLKNCDSCRKALKVLQASGLDAVIHDLRKDGLDAARLDRWLSALGPEKLLNKRGTTWRNLDDSLRKSLDKPDLRALMLSEPALIKRPVIECEGDILVGFGETERRRLIGE